jgi:hypothetical protein
LKRKKRILGKSKLYLILPMKLKRMQLLGNSGDYDVITVIGGTVGISTYS